MIQDTSHESYKLSRPEFPARQREVIDALRALSTANNRELARHIRRPINTVTPTTHRLRRLGLVEEDRRDVDPETERRVIFWRLVQPPTEGETP